MNFGIGDNDVRYDWGMKEMEHLSPHINNIEVFSNADLKLHSDLWYIPGNSKKKKKLTIIGKAFICLTKLSVGNRQLQKEKRKKECKPYSGVHDPGFTGFGKS